MFNNLNPVDFAYIAGIIDGEGTITLTRHKRNCHPSPTITIASSDFELINWLKRKLDCGQIIKKKNYNKGKHKDSWTFMLRHNNVLLLLEAIEPFLIIHKKKERCKLILEEYKKLTPRNGRYSEELLDKKQDFYCRFMET